MSNWTSLRIRVLNGQSRLLLRFMKQDSYFTPKSVYGTYLELDIRGKAAVYNIFHISCSMKELSLAQLTTN